MNAAASYAASVALLFFLLYRCRLPQPKRSTRAALRLPPARAHRARTPAAPRGIQSISRQTRAIPRGAPRICPRTPGILPDIPGILPGIRTDQLRATKNRARHQLRLLAPADGLEVLMPRRRLLRADRDGAPHARLPGTTRVKRRWRTSRARNRIKRQP